jgi:sugar/nucleoside kinase (ribokinase family)
MKTVDVVVAGYLCIDLIPAFQEKTVPSGIHEIFRPGRLIEIDGLDFVPGGVVANTGLALKKFNRKVVLNGLAGNDPWGTMLKQWFSEYGLSGGIRTTGRKGTALSIILAPPGIDRIFLESTGCNEIFDETFIDFQAVSRSKIFHFGYPPLLKLFYRDHGKNLVSMLSRIQGMGVCTSLDFSLPDRETESGKVNWPEIMNRVLPNTDIFVPSLEEALFIMLPARYDELKNKHKEDDLIDHVPMEVIRDLGRRIIASGVRILLIKMAHRGAYLATGNISEAGARLDCILDEEQWNDRELLCEPYQAEPSKIKSASGTGDTAAAAFLAAMLEGKDPESALKYAALAGRNNLYCNDIMAELDDWETMNGQLIREPGRVISFNHLTNNQ